MLSAVWSGYEKRTRPGTKSAGKSLSTEAVVDAAAFLAGVAAAFFPLVPDAFFATAGSDSALPPANCAATVPATIFFKGDQLNF